MITMWVAIKDSNGHRCIRRKFIFMRIFFFFFFFFQVVFNFESNRLIVSNFLSDKVEWVCQYQLCL